MDWRLGRPPYPVHTADYAPYVQILTWFLDTPVKEAPLVFMAEKEGAMQWFGPSIAAGSFFD